MYTFDCQGDKNMEKNNGKEKRARELFAKEVQEEKANKGWNYNRNLLETSIDSLVTIGPDGIITDVNSATEKATGLPREKIIGTDFSEYFTEPDKARVGYKQVFDIGKVVDYELYLKHINGSSIPVLYNASVYKDNEGQIVGVLAVARDISAIKKHENELIDFENNIESIVQQKTEELNNQLESRVTERTAQLEFVNKELEALSYSISHDLKAPLRHISGYISLLVKKHKNLLPEEGRRYLDNISSAAMNMGELIDGLLQFSRTGRIEMNQKLLDMNQIVDALIQPNREQDQQHRICLL